MSEWLGITAAIVGIIGGIGGVAALLMVPMQRRKLKADAAAVIVDSAVDLLQPLREQCAQLEARNDRLQRKAQELDGELTKALGVVREIKLELAGPRPSIEKLRGIVGMVPRNGT